MSGLVHCRPPPVLVPQCNVTERLALHPYGTAWTTNGQVVDTPIAPHSVAELRL